MPYDFTAVGCKMKPLPARNSLPGWHSTDTGDNQGHPADCPNRCNGDAAGRGEKGLATGKKVAQVFIRTKDTPVLPLPTDAIRHGAAVGGSCRAGDRQDRATGSSLRFADERDVGLQVRFSGLGRFLLTPGGAERFP